MSRGSTPMWVGGASALALGLWLFAGIYSVDSDESAVAFVFGRASASDVLPGIHWNPPWPLGRVVVAKTATNFTMPVGYRFSKAMGPPISDLWLTGDTNVVTGRLNIQYSVSNLTALVTAHESPQELVRWVGERALTRFLISEQVDGVLAGRRAELRNSVAREAQAFLEGVGITVQSVTVEELAPPTEGRVRGSFQDVQNASSDRDRTILEAKSYLRQTLAEAEGETERLLSEARSDRHRRIELARGEAARFTALAREHARAPRVTERRLYLETLETLLPNLETYVLEEGHASTVNLRIVQ